MKRVKIKIIKEYFDWGKNTVGQKYEGYLIRDIVVDNILEISNDIDMNGQKWFFNSIKWFNNQVISTDCWLLKYEIIES